MDAKTILIVWLILSGLGHLIFTAMLWNNSKFSGMRIRRLVMGAGSWWMALWLLISQDSGVTALFTTITSWGIAIMGTALLIFSYFMYRTGKDLD